MKIAPIIKIIAKTLLIITLSGFMSGCMMTQRVFAASLMGEKSSRAKLGTALAVDAVTLPVQVFVSAAQQATKKQ